MGYQRGFAGDEQASLTRILAGDILDLGECESPGSFRPLLSPFLDSGDLHEELMSTLSVGPWERASRVLSTPTGGQK